MAGTWSATSYHKKRFDIEISKTISKKITQTKAEKPSQATDC